jgi:hypothetical protein
MTALVGLDRGADRASNDADVSFQRVVPLGTALWVVMRCTLDVRSGSKADHLFNGRLSAFASSGHGATWTWTDSAPEFHNNPAPA